MDAQVSNAKEFVGEAEMAKGGSDMVCCGTISKPRLILSEISIGSSGHSCKLGRWMLTLVSIIHPMVTIKGQVTNLSTNLTGWPFWLNSIGIRLCLLKLIEGRELRWSIRSFTTSIIEMASTSSSIKRLIKTIFIRLWSGCCYHSKDGIFDLRSII